MPLTLRGRTVVPRELEVHTFTMMKKEERVHIGSGIKIPLSDFCEMVKYVLTNTSLQENDPRLNLLQELQGMQVVQTPDGGERLVLQTSKDAN